MKLRVVLLAGLFSAPMAFAEKAVDSADCKPLVDACEKAGFAPGAHQAKDGKAGGEGLWVDCIGAVSNGKVVEGVTFGKEEADKCMATKKETHETKKAAAKKTK
jgi:hypothetical protein